MNTMKAKTDFHELADGKVIWDLPDGNSIVGLPVGDVKLIV